MSGFERLLIGRVVGRHYRIEEVLGDGGFGVVFRAADLRPERAARRVAVKVLKVPVRATPEELRSLRARFRHEAAFASRLPPHPGIVPVHDYGTDPELDRDYIVMELLEGEDLRTRLLRPDPLPLPQALRILRDAARALAVGHAAGLVHRDVKPGNIFLARAPGGGEPTVRVLDFGIAKALSQEGDQTSTHLTVDGNAPLSRRYAAPEQLRGERDLTCAVDVFALGVVAFEALTRTRLYTEADQGRREAGLPVPTPSLRARNPEVPPEVESLVLHALEHDPRVRFPDAAAFVGALQRVCARAGISLDRAAAAVHAAGGEDATLAAVAEEGTALLEERRAAGPPPAARRWGTRLRPLSRRVAVAAVGVGIVAMGSSMVMQLAGEAGPPLPATRLVAERPPAAEAAAANQEGLRLFEAREYEAALPHFERAASLQPEHPEYRNNVGYTLYRMGRADDAVEVLEEVVERHPSRHVAYANLADAYLQQGDTARAVEALEHLLSLDPSPTRRKGAEQVLARITPDSESDDVYGDDGPEVEEHTTQVTGER